jgi:hypothetical protein
MANGNGRVVRFHVERTSGGGWAGTVQLPAAGGALMTTVTAKGPSKNVALARAMGLAQKVLSSPVFKAFLPPQAAFAIKAAGALAKAGPKIARAAAKIFKSKALRGLAKLFG